MYLNCHTCFSMKYGTIAPRELLEAATRLGIGRLAVTDINNTSAFLEVLRLSADYPVAPVPGVDFRNGEQQQFVAIAKNNEGYREINALLSTYLHNNETIPPLAPELQNAFVIYPWEHVSPGTLPANGFAGIRLRDATRLLHSPWRHHQDRLVLLQPVTLLRPEDFSTHRLLRAIDNNTLLSKLPHNEVAEQDEYLHPAAVLRHAFRACPEVLRNSEALLAAAHFNFDFSPRKHRNLRCYSNNETLDFKLLAKLARDGVRYRYPPASEKVYQRLEHELEVIRKQDFTAYFLIAWKVVKYARSKGYFYVGRGSGANSIVAYLLRITDVDPVDLDLYFERFINLFRKNPPDFDIDFSWRDRQDVTAFIFRRFPNVALLATYNTFRRRSVIRELGKVLGMPAGEISALQKNKRATDHLGALVLKYSKCIHGLPSHLSVHAGGIIVSRHPIHSYCATSLPPKGFPITHFDMHTAEDIGLYKFDILGQRGLAKIRDTLQLIKASCQSSTVDIHDIPALKNDAATNGLLKTGNAIGCFYVESPAMRMLLKKLRVSDYRALVAASSVIRPGVAQSGMMREYILRFRYPERREEARRRQPVLYNLMPETFGVMVYQEDVIKVAHYFAGLELGEADMLRRGMSGKFRSRAEFRQVRERFISNCRKKGYEEQVIAAVWAQIESFAGYAFAKGHSASYAVESYQCLYLKAHYPLAFMTAVLNNGGGFYSTAFYLHEARRHGAQVMLPCINNGEALCSLQSHTLYIGLQFIKSLEVECINEILEERHRNGPFKSLSDLISRVVVSKEQLSILIRSGALRTIEKDKKKLLWQTHFLLSGQKRSRPQPGLFRTAPRTLTIPKLWYHKLEHAFDELELLGYPVSVSPFEFLESCPGNTCKASELPALTGKTIEIPGLLVHAKRTTTKGGKRMYFGTFLDRNGDWLDTVHFPRVAASHPFRGPGVYLIKGKVVEEFGYYSVEVQQMQHLAMQQMDDEMSGKGRTWPVAELSQPPSPLAERT